MQGSQEIRGKMNTEKARPVAPETLATEEELTQDTEGNVKDSN